MPSISGKTTLTTGATVANVLLGSQYELAPFDGTIEIGLMADRANVSCAIFSGSDILQEPGGNVPFGPTLGTQSMPKYPDDYHWEDEVQDGDRLKITLLNSDALTTIVNWVLRITPA